MSSATSLCLKISSSLHGLGRCVRWTEAVRHINFEVAAEGLILACFGTSATLKEILNMMDLGRGAKSHDVVNVIGANIWKAWNSMVANYCVHIDAIPVFA